MKNKYPLVSVIMPVFNAESYLKEAIQSILFQTYYNLDFIILDDASIDNSWAIINSFDDSRIRAFRSKNNEGLIKQLNKGIILSKGEYIARMDADDIAVTSRIKKQVNFMLENKNVGVCATFVTVISQSGSFLRQWEMPIDHDSIKVDLLEGAVLCHPTVMFRSSLFIDKSNIYSDNYSHIEDYELWIRLINKTKFAVLPFFLLKYRTHSFQVSNLYKEHQNSQMEKLREKQILNIVGEANIDYKQVIYLLSSKWKNIELDKMYNQLRMIEAKAINIGYSKQKLQYLFSKRLHYYFASTRSIDILQKIKVIKLYWKYIKLWNIKFFVWFLVKKRK